MVIPGEGALVVLVYCQRRCRHRRGLRSRGICGKRGGLHKLLGQARAGFVLFGQADRSIPILVCTLQLAVELLLGNRVPLFCGLELGLHFHAHLFSRSLCGSLHRELRRLLRALLHGSQLCDQPAVGSLLAGCKRSRVHARRSCSCRLHLLLHCLHFHRVIRNGISKAGGNLIVRGSKRVVLNAQALHGLLCRIQLLHAPVKRLAQALVLFLHLDCALRLNTKPLLDVERMGRRRRVLQFGPQANLLFFQSLVLGRHLRHASVRRCTLRHKRVVCTAHRRLGRSELGVRTIELDARVLKKRGQTHHFTRVVDPAVHVARRDAPLRPPSSVRDRRKRRADRGARRVQRERERWYGRFRTLG